MSPSMFLAFDIEKKIKNKNSKKLCPKNSKYFGSCSLTDYEGLLLTDTVLNSINCKNQIAVVTFLCGDQLPETVQLEERNAYCGTYLRVSPSWSHCVNCQQAERKEWWCSACFIFNSAWDLHSWDATAHSVS